MADHLHEQPLLGAEVVVQEAARHARLAGHVVERRGGGAARADARAHRLDDPLRLLSLEPARGLDRCLHPGAILAGRPTTLVPATRPFGRASVKHTAQDDAGYTRGARRRPSKHLRVRGPPGGAHRFARSRFRRGRGRGTRTPPRRRTGRRGPSCADPRSAREQGLRRRARRGASGRYAASLLAAQRVGSLAQRDGRLAKLLLRLLVLGQRPDGIPLPDMRE